MLKKLYQAGSLENTERGAVFLLRNAIAPAHITGIDFVRVGEETYVDQVSIRLGEREMGAGEISPDNPILIPLGHTVQVIIAGLHLAPGTYPVAVGIRTKEVGPLAVEVSDTVK